MSGFGRGPQLKQRRAALTIRPTTPLIDRRLPPAVSAARCRAVGQSPPPRGLRGRRASGSPVGRTGEPLYVRDSGPRFGHRFAFFSPSKPSDRGASRGVTLSVQHPDGWTQPSVQSSRFSPSFLRAVVRSDGDKLYESHPGRRVVGRRLDGRGEKAQVIGAVGAGPDHLCRNYTSPPPITTTNPPNLAVIEGVVDLTRHRMTGKPTQPRTAG